MSQSEIKRLAEFGQSLWYDNISRSIIREGKLAAMVEEDGVSGVTSNPSIFRNAIAKGADYDRDIRELAGEGRSSAEIVRTLMVRDIREAADVLRQVYDRTGGEDGFVSIECDPHLAHRTEATVEEALRLNGEVDRPNVMIKVPGTAEGIPAVRELLARNVNVNVTLLFSPEHYRRAAEAYLEALEERRRASLPVEGIRSVASIFLSRIDTAVDGMLDSTADTVRAPDREAARRLRGRAALAVAGTIYGNFREAVSSRRFAALAGAGAGFQRPLWASTGTKDPAYPDLKYVEPLVGPHTVNTVPQATLDALRDHGRIAETLTAAVREAREVMPALAGLGIDLDGVCGKLQDDGVKAFQDAYDALTEAVSVKAGG